MLVLVTGVPGAGKTLNTIKEVLAVQKESEKEGKPRPVYYYNIKGVQIEGWTEMTEEETKNWQDLPEGSLIVVDEAQAIFPQRGPRQEMPAHVEPLNTHRHRGIDFYIVTQHARMIDVAVRRLVGKHLHFDRRFGSSSVNRYTFQTVEEDPKERYNDKGTIRESVPLDKKIFELYKSAEVHTHKRKYPVKLLIAAAFLVAIPALGFLGYKTFNFTNPDDPKPVQHSSPEAPRVTGKIFNRDNDDLSYAERYKPRVQGFPHTAPIYDELTTPVTYPKYNCVVIASQLNSCKCYSQQATEIDTTVAICLSIIDKGLFDPAREEPKAVVRQKPAETPQRHTGAGSAGANRFVLLTHEPKSSFNRSTR